MKKTRSVSKSVAKNKSPPKQTKKDTKPGKYSSKKNKASSQKRGKSQVAAQISDDDSHTAVAFAQGTYVAFVEPAESVEVFKIAHLNQNLSDDDENVQVDIFEEIAPMTFKKVASSNKRQGGSNWFTIEADQIICDVNVTEDKQAKKNTTQVKITKQQHNKVVKLMPSIIKNLQEGSESEDEEEDDEDEEEESESEESEEEEKQTVEDIKKRRMVKAQPANKKVQERSTRSRSKAPQTQENPKTKKVPSPSPQKGKQAKSSSKKAQPKSKKQKEEEKDDQDEDMKDEDESVEVINTSSKRKGAVQKKAKSLSQVLQKVGKKRTRKSISPSENDQSEFAGSQEEDSHVVKKRKVSKGKAQVVKTPKEKKPKTPKRPKEFKKGRWNPAIELLETEKYKESPENKLYLQCCIRCNNKNAIRAVHADNGKLLKECMDSKQKISNLNAFWSPDSQETAIEYITTHNLHDMLEILLHPKVGNIPAHSTYDAERAKIYTTRVNNPPYLLSFVDSGMVNNMAYGTRVRKVQMTRGNRQGNNAFLQYTDNNEKSVIYYTQNEQFLKKILYSHTISYETIKQLIKLNANVENTINVQVYEAVRAGQREIAYELIKNLVKHQNWGFNQLHCDVLGKDDNFDKILRVSTTKKCNTNKDITPMHCASINPNENMLKQLLDINPDTNIVDADLRRPVHYAAACEGPGPIRLLINRGASLIDQDNQKNNCLHVACFTGRHESVRAILEHAPQLLNTKNKKGMNAMAYACKYGNTECVKVLLEFKARVNAGCGIERSTPLCWAAAYGHYELCEFLLDNKGRVLGKDKFKRTPLLLAVRNGHSKIASLLLQRGAEWNHADSSMNTALHYAASYGWLECMDVLLKAGADVNAANSWKITPINIAMLLNHTGCVKRLLDEPNVDVNGKDEKGRTLLILSMIALDDDSYDFIKYLLQKGANPNIVDLEGQGPLHYIAKYNPTAHIDHTSHLTQKEQYAKQVEIQKQVATILIQNNADLTLKDSDEHTPFALCLQSDNAELLEFLQDKVSLNKEPELFFAFNSKIFQVQYQKILLKLLKNDPPMKDTINTLDKEGMTPFLRYVQQFTQDYLNLLTQITYRVNAQSYIHGVDRKKYKITNEDLFDKLPDATHFYTYHYNLNDLDKQRIAKEFLEQIIVKPFINTINVLINNGAEVQSKVEKLKFYREMDIADKVKFAQISEEMKAKMQQEKEKEKEKEKVKKRDEVMREKRSAQARYGGRGKKPARRAAFGNNAYLGGVLPAQQAQYQDQQQQIDVFDTRNGEKVLRQYGKQGQQNAIHIIMKCPFPALLKFLVSLDIDVDQPDYDGITPFNILSKKDLADIQFFELTYEELLKKDVRIDYPDIKGRTPFLNYYEIRDLIYSYRMLDLGANVNQMDTSGLFALKYALIRRENEEIENLIQRGANINQIDNKGRNLLHHAVNMSSATADATFETEQFLIDRGVELNLKDDRDRTPLHYAFVKIGKWGEASQIDPIETVSSLCGCKGLEIDVPDKWQKTPLHYASQRGASICSIYLIKRGANLETKDIYGNTPLGIGLLRQHYNYGIILIQNQIAASVLPLVYNEYPDKIQKKWDLEAKLAKRNQNQNGSKPKFIADENSMEVDDDNNDKIRSKKRHRDLFDPNVNVVYDDYDDEDDYGNEDAASDDMAHENVFNQQNAFGMNVYNTAGTNMMGGFAFGQNNGFGGPFGGGFGTVAAAPAIKTMPYNFGNPSQQNQLQQQLNQGYLPKEDEGVSLFKLAIRGGQQGLAYLMIDNGYPLMLAIQDAMDEKKFLLVLTLLSKNPDDEVIQQKNNKGQTLFHILAMNASGCNAIHLERIYMTLKKRGVNCKAKDIYQRTALHYAVKSESLQLVQLILNQEEGYQLNEIDVDGQTPLSTYMQGEKCKFSLYSRLFPQANIFSVLAQKGADVNYVYPEKCFKPSFNVDEVDEKYEDYDPKAQYKSTFLINVIRQQGDQKVMEDNVIGLIEYGAKLNITDSDGKDAIMYAIQQDNLPILKLFLDNQKEVNVNKECQDKAGKSACHYVVNPVKFGSFENIDILKLLHQHKFNLKLKDAQGKIPLAYAAEQESGKLFKELQKLSGQAGDIGRLSRMVSTIVSKDWPQNKVDFEQDSETFMEVALKKEEEEYKEKKNRIPVDETGNFEKSYQVYYDDDNKPWDIYLNKVDLKNGMYGDYVFYKMQLLYDTNRDLYVVFTRWGRIGEVGMNQRTPFNNLEEAKIEYKKIFKQKTGNDFDNLEQFQRQKKKYTIAKIVYVTTNYKEYLQPFDYDKCPKSKLQKQLYDLFEEISNVTMYQRAMNEFGINSNVMPFSAVSKDSIIQARQLLMEIGETLKEDQDLMRQGIKADYEQVQSLKERIYELSSRYYELIPLARYANQIAPPLSNAYNLKEQFDNLESLTNIEFASKMLLGALYRQTEMNPADYVYQALNLMIEDLDKNGPEFEVINSYIKNTRNDQNQNYYNQGNEYEVSNIFKIQRKGEAEMITAYKEVPNHFLLYHGSMLFNFLGILSQGLRIAPPEAPPTGYMFGKGVYFADMFDKSAQYSQRGYAQQDSYLMLMCEVALGKSKQLLNAEYVENLEPQFQSVKGVGRRGPSYDHTLVLPNGVKIPYGKVVDYFADKPEQQRNVSLQHNEFIVYNTSQVRMRYLVQIKKVDKNKKK